MIRIVMGFFGLIIMLFFIVVGFYEPRAVIFAVLCMLGPIITALLGFNRSWCRYICPRGLLYEQYFKRGSTPKMLLNKWFKILVVCVIFGVMGTAIYNNISSMDAIGTLLHRMIIVTTLIGVLLGIKYSSRAWCCFCPMGSIASFIISIKRKFWAD